ncbi:sugar metabolism cluster protein [Vibrio cholerae]|nr:sugar metabolism cluster protein [Vibrio cholerae]
MKNKIVILAAGLPHLGENPALSQTVGGLSIIDWQLNSLDLISENIDVVLGFRASEQKHSFQLPINFLENKEWETTKSAGSLLLVDLNQVDELWISYGDVLYHSQAVQQISSTQSEAVVAYDSEWRTRYLGRDHSDISEAEKVIVSNNQVQRLGSGINTEWATGEFVGLACLRGQALDILKQLKLESSAELKNLTLPDLLELIRTKGVSLTGVDLKGQWAELNEPRDLAHFVMGTKAETLARLRTMVKISQIQDQVSFTVAEWKNNPGDLIHKVKINLPCEKLVVRSSARSEDAFTHSNAGAYTSLLNVEKEDKSLTAAIETVIASYHNLQDDDQVLIQPMLTNVVMSGVVFTRTLEQGAPYLVINYDETGSTEGITSGQATQNSVFYFHKKATVEQVTCPKLKKLVRAIQEIETLLNYDALDIEFAVDQNGDVHIFQVRPITLQQHIHEHLDVLIAQGISQAATQFSQLQHADSPIVGHKAIFGNMPDWNPAEIIGTNPGELAYSLYRYLILDDVWAQQRAQYGYRDVRPIGLLKRFVGKPYIDVRASLNSFIPKSLPDDLATRLVDFYTNWLVEHPHLHDKIEFDVIPTCLSLNFERWEKRLTEQGGFTYEEVMHVQQGLSDITNKAIIRVEADLKKVEQLASKLDVLARKSTSELYTIKALLDDCKRFGTLPFAHLARAGFIAVTFLKEAVTVGLISKQAQEDFLASINTVSHTLANDAYQVKMQTMPWQEFVNKYGHLRPGTYDIYSQAYHEDPERFLAPLVLHAHELKQQTQQESAWELQKTALFDGLRRIGINATDQQIETFMRLAIEGREKAKFIFSRSLSKALDGLVSWGKKNKLSREELAELPITRLLEYLDQPALTLMQSELLREQADLNNAERKLSLAYELPPLIASEQDFSLFTLNESHPNYIGSNKINTAVVSLNGQAKDQIVTGKIVMIPQADPGYDWLFGQGIAGLITMYGGANSHMAIRSAEFGLPAAIGVGENIYKTLLQAKILELDPANSVIRVIY